MPYQTSAARVPYSDEAVARTGYQEVVVQGQSESIDRIAHASKTPPPSAYLSIGLHIPCPDRPVERSREECASIGAQSQCINPCIMTLQAAQLASVLGFQ